MRRAMLPAGMLVAMGCQGYEGNVADLAGYDVSALAFESTYIDSSDGFHVLRHLSYSFSRKASSSERAGCASVGDADIRFNGRRIDAWKPGGWGPTQDFYKNGDECIMPSIHVPQPVPAAIEDTLLEISGQAARFVVAVPALHGERQLTLDSVTPSEILLRLEPAVEATVTASLRASRWSSDSQLLKGSVAGGLVRLELPPGLRGSRFLDVKVRRDEAVTGCEGFTACKGAVYVGRELPVVIP